MSRKRRHWTRGSRAQGLARIWALGEKIQMGGKSFAIREETT